MSCSWLSSGGGGAGSGGEEGDERDLWGRGEVSGSKRAAAGRDQGMSERELQGSGRQETTGARFGAGRARDLGPAGRARFGRGRGRGRRGADRLLDLRFGGRRKGLGFCTRGQAKIWVEDECKRAREGGAHLFLVTDHLMV